MPVLPTRRSIATVTPSAGRMPRVSAEAFGAAQGRAMARLGQSIERTSQIALEAVNQRRLARQGAEDAAASATIQQAFLIESLESRENIVREAPQDGSGMVDRWTGQWTEDHVNGTIDRIAAERGFRISDAARAQIFAQGMSYGNQGIVALAQAETAARSASFERTALNNGNNLAVSVFQRPDSLQESLAVAQDQIRAAQAYLDPLQLQAMQDTLPAQLWEAHYRGRLSQGDAAGVLRDLQGLQADDGDFPLTVDQIRALMQSARADVEVEDYREAGMRAAEDAWRAGTSGEPMPAGTGPRGVRNNNPGNIEASDFTARHGAVGDDGRFAQFETPVDGIGAAARLLLSYQDNQGINTIEGIVNRWAPSSENDVDAYIAALSASTGFAPDQELNFRSPDTMEALLRAIIHHENGRQPYPIELIRAGMAAAEIGDAPDADAVAAAEAPYREASAAAPTEPAPAVDPETLTLDQRFARAMEALQAAPMSAEQRVFAEQRVRQWYADERAIEEGRINAARDEAWRLAEEGATEADVPANVWAVLTVDDHQALRSYMAGEHVITDRELYDGLFDTMVRAPDEFLNTDLRQHRGQLAPNDYDRLRVAQGAMLEDRRAQTQEQQAEIEGQIAEGFERRYAPIETTAADIQRTSRSLLAAVGIDPADDAEDYARFEGYVFDRVMAFRRQNGRDPEDADLRQIAEDGLAQVETFRFRRGEYVETSGYQFEAWIPFENIPPDIAGQIAQAMFDESSEVAELRYAPSEAGVEEVFNSIAQQARQADMTIEEFVSAASAQSQIDEMPATGAPPPMRAGPPADPVQTLGEPETAFIEPDAEERAELRAMLEARMNSDDPERIDRLLERVIDIARGDRESVADVMARLLAADND